MSGIPYDADDADIMARTLWGEARNQPYTGQLAVGWVIRNRAGRREFAGELWNQAGAVKHVCLAPYQFSCWLEGDPNRAQIDALRVDEFQVQRDVVAAVLGDSVPDPTNGASHYFTVAAPPGISPWPPAWAYSMARVAVIGAHAFYDDQKPVVRWLRQGMAGADVEALNRRLAGLGLPAGTLSFDGETLAGVLAFQKANRLDVDGIAGPQTLGVLGLV